MTTTTPATTAPVTTTAAPASTSSTSPDAMAQLSGNFSTFLTLLTTQLKNQDPTEPMDSNQFTKQLVEFSQVEQQINSNNSLKTLISQGTSQAGISATTYLGRNVSVTNGKASLTSGQANWSYTLGTASAATQLSVTEAMSPRVMYCVAEIAT